MSGGAAPASGPVQRPPKTRRPWPVVRLRWDEDLDDARAVVDRWEAGVATPWVDPLTDEVVGRTGGDVGAPASRGTSLGPARALLYTFVWEDSEADEVLFWANRLADETCLDDTLTERVPGTDLWLARFVMPSDWRASYCFLTRPRGGSAPWGSEDQVNLRQALDAGRADPRCPVLGRNRNGIGQSVAVGPHAPRATATEPAVEPAIPPGSLTRHRVAGREVVLHDPAGVVPDEPLDVLLVLDGEVWLVQQQLAATLDRRVASGEAPPRRTVFIHSGGREQRWNDLGGNGDAVGELVDVILPWVRSVRGCTADPGGVAVAGQSLGGITALRVALQRPAEVGVALSCSASLWQDDLAADVVALATGDGPLPRVHLSHGAQEWVLAPPHERLADVLAEVGVELCSVSHQGGHDYAWWRVALESGLAWWAEGRPATIPSGCDTHPARLT